MFILQFLLLGIYTERFQVVISIIKDKSYIHTHISLSLSLSLSYIYIYIYVCVCVYKDP